MRATLRARPGLVVVDAQEGSDLLVTKQVSSSFHGTPDLHARLSAAGTTGIVVCGITTSQCWQTTAGVGATDAVLAELAGAASGGEGSAPHE